MTDRLLLTGRAAVRAISDQTALMQHMKDNHAGDPSIFSEHPPFFWRAIISNNNLDAYGTRMAPSTLENFAADAQTGVSFQNSHNTRELGFGRSIQGWTEKLDAGEMRALADFYTIPGLNLNGVSTDDFIRAVKAGIAKDVSVGFYGGEFRCSICGGDMLDWFGDCVHIPLETYSVVERDEEGNVINEREEVAVAWIENARLAEVSAVYEGATPGAAILKAEQEAARGHLTGTQIRKLETRYGVRISPRVSVPGYQSKQEERDMPDEKKEAKATVSPLVERDAQLMEECRAILREANLTAGTSGDSTVRDQIRVLVEKVKDAEALKERVAQLERAAKDGEAYRRSIIEEALKQGVRARGDKFDREKFQRIFDGMDDLALIREMSEDWKETGDARLPAGRRTVDADTSEDDQNVIDLEDRRNLPTSAFRG